MELVHRQWLDSDGFGRGRIRGVAGRDGGIANRLKFEVRSEKFEV